MSSEVLSAPQAADGIVVVRTADGRIFGLDAPDGKRKWLYQRAMPALALRSYAGVVVARGAVFAGFAGGKLVALNLPTAMLAGRRQWHCRAAPPNWNASPTSPACRWWMAAVCAVAYQGRVACFDIPQRQSAMGARCIQQAGLAMDQRNCLRERYARRSSRTGQNQRRQRMEAGQAAARQLLRRWCVATILPWRITGYVHLLAREDGGFAARLATDGSRTCAAGGAETRPAGANPQWRIVLHCQSNK